MHYLSGLLYYAFHKIKLIIYILFLGHASTSSRLELYNIKKKMKYYKNDTIKLREKLRAASKCDIRKIVQKLSPVVKNFLDCQIKNACREYKGRRYSIDDKIFVLSLYKQSPRRYRYLSAIFSLPCSKTLRKLLQHIPVKAGVLDAVLDQLKFKAEKMDTKSKLCVLMFDEMSLKVHTHYCRHDDTVIGFVDNGIERKNILADHAQVLLC